MPDVHGQAHLMRRGAVYYYRRRVPDDIVSVIGKSMIQYSLKTKDKKEAVAKCRVADVEWDARFAEAGANSGTQGPGVSHLTSAEAVELVQRYVARTAKLWWGRHASDPPTTADQKREMIVEMAESIQMLTDPEDDRGDASVSRQVWDLLHQSGKTAEPGEPVMDELGELVRRGLIELYRRRLGWLQDDFEKDAFDHLFAGQVPAVAAIKVVTFAELGAEYLDDYRANAKVRGIDQKRVDKVAASLALVEEIVGPATPVGQVDYDAAVRLRNTLAKVPKNRSKHYPGVALDKAIAAASQTGAPMMAYETQQTYLQIFRAVLDLGVKKKLLTNNPAGGLSPLATKTPAADKRQPFTIDELNAIFAAPLYTGCVDDRHNFAKPGPNVIRRARFWVPLICLFTGMRTNEVCQLHLDDVRTSEAGTPYIRVTDERPDQRVKNATSRRVIPVHPELIKIGFLDYVDHHREGGQERLFPELKPDGRGYYSTRLADWFSESFIKSVFGQPLKRKSLHSMRHNFRDALRHANAPDWVLQALGGWNQGRSVSDHYGKTDWPDQLNAWMGKIDYAGLTLLHLSADG